MPLSLPTLAPLALLGALAVTPTRAASWECLDRIPHPHESSPPIYCLVRCEDWDEDTWIPAHDQPLHPNSVAGDWCPNAAADYCEEFDLEYGDSCWGARR